MKPLVLLLSLALAALTGFANPLPESASTAPVTSSNQNPSDKIEILLAAQERETWEAVKRHDAAAFANLCLENIYEIYGDGTLLTLKDMVEQIPDTDILEYTIEDLKVIRSTAETALVRYRIFAKVSYKGVVAPPAWMLASAVWVKTPKGWKAAMYQETPLPKS